MDAPEIRGKQLDDALDALGHVQRRSLLVSLLSHNPQDDAPVSIAGAESEAESVKRLVRMRHVHLPKLEEYGFIEWNRETNEVAKGPRFGEIRPLLELMDDHEEELPGDWL